MDANEQQHLQIKFLLLKKAPNYLTSFRLISPSSYATGQPQYYYEIILAKNNGTCLNDEIKEIHTNVSSTCWS